MSPATNPLASSSTTDKAKPQERTAITLFLTRRILTAGCFTRHILIARRLTRRILTGSHLSHPFLKLLPFPTITPALRQFNLPSLFLHFQSCRLTFPLPNSFPSFRMQLHKHLALPISRPSSSPALIVTRILPSPIPSQSHPAKPSPPQTANQKTFIILKSAIRHTVNKQGPLKVVSTPPATPQCGSPRKNNILFNNPQ